MDLGSNDWCFSKLPKHVLELNIFSRLGLDDLIWFSAVSHSCKSIIIENLCYLNQLLWLMLSRDEQTGRAKFFSIMEPKFYHLTLSALSLSKWASCLGSSRGYLIMATRSKNFLFNPFSKKEIHLPVQYVPRVKSQLHFWNLGYYFKKAILSVYTTSDYVVSALSFDSGIIEMCRPQDCEWSIFGADKNVNQTKVHYSVTSDSDDDEQAEKKNVTVSKELNRDRWFCDILFYKDMLYGLTQNNGLMTFELQNDPKKPLEYTGLNVLPMDKPTDDNFQSITSYLVESCRGDLLMVYRFSNLIKDGGLRRSITGKFIVFKLEQESGDCFRWINLQNLSDQILFLGKKSSMSFSCIGIPGIRGNCIYFTEDLFEFLSSIYKELYNFSDSGIYYLEDGRIESLFSGSDSQTFRSQPIWVTPDVVLGNNV